MRSTGSKEIRLLTYNIHGCVGRDGLEDPEGILEVIRATGADFVALQEVQDNDAADRSFLRGLDRLDYAEVIYGETMRKPAGAYGNILLSQHHLADVRRIDLSQDMREPRGLIIAEGSLFGHDIRIMATHLGLFSRERSHQVQRLMEFAGSGSGYEKSNFIEILMGDMNEWSVLSRNSRKLMRAYRFASIRRTFPVRWPVFPLDRIFVNGPVESVRFTRIDSDLVKRVSDHRPLMADIILE